MLCTVQQYRVNEPLHPFIVLAEPGEMDQYVNATMPPPGITVLAKPLDTTQLLIAGMHQLDMNSIGVGLLNWFAMPMNSRSTQCGPVYRPESTFRCSVKLSHSSA